MLRTVGRQVAVLPEGTKVPVPSCSACGNWAIGLFSWSVS